MTKMGYVTGTKVKVVGLNIFNRGGLTLVVSLGYVRTGLVPDVTAYPILTISTINNTEGDCCYFANNKKIIYKYDEYNFGGISNID